MAEFTYEMLPPRIAIRCKHDSVCYLYVAHNSMVSKKAQA